jgi:signal recognition particle receptor subunit alpha
MNVVGKAALSRADVEPALAEMKRKLMERNVAEEIAAQVSGRRSLRV